VSALPFWDRHRGPYRLVVCRPHPRKKGHSTSEILTGVTRHGADVQEEARALLTDPRDTIVTITVWSESEECFVMSYTRGK